jgi:hypothetical protein
VIPLSSMMHTKLVIAFAMLAITINAYQADEVLLETLPETFSHATDTVPEIEFMLQEAHAEIKKSADVSACADMAKTLVDVSYSEDAKNKQAMATAQDATRCDKLFVDEVNAATADLDAKTKGANEAAGTLAAATDAPVTVTKPLSSYACDSLMGDSAYLAAVKARNDAADAKSTADALVAAAKDSLQNALATQSKQQTECKCAVERAVEAVWKTIAASDAKLKEDYAKGIKMQCVLEGKDVSSAPCQKKLSPITKPADKVDEKKCVKYQQQQPDGQCNPQCGLGSSTLYGSLVCRDVRDQKAGLAACAAIGLVKPAIPHKVCPPTAPCPTPAPTTQAPTTRAPTKSRCYDTGCCVSYISGGCSEERREGWDREERSECRNRNQYNPRGADYSFEGCYWNGNDIYPSRL